MHSRTTHSLQTPREPGLTSHRAGGAGLCGGDTGDEAFWSEFFRSLRARGLKGVRLVISDHYFGLQAAIAKVFIGVAWQRCRVHFMRNPLARVTRANSHMVAAAIRTISAHPDADAVAAQFERITTTLGQIVPPRDRHAPRRPPRPRCLPSCRRRSLLHH